MGKQLIVFTEMDFILNLPIQVFFYAFSELLPLMSYVYCQRKFVDAIFPELNNPDGANNGDEADDEAG